MKIKARVLNRSRDRDVFERVTQIEKIGDIPGERACRKDQIFDGHK